jgi:hypothetical protein
MIASTNATCFPSPAVESRFLLIQSNIERHARIYFRHVVCRHKRDDLISEAVALGWKWFLQLTQRGKDPTRFPGPFARYTARAVQNGRRVCGLLKPKDVMSERAQRRHGLSVESLPLSTRRCLQELYGSCVAQRQRDAYEERLQHNTQAAVPDQVSFRIDFPAWLKTRTARDRRIIAEMIRDERTTDLARAFGMSPARVSQLRREYWADWQRFTTEPVPFARSASNGLDGDRG